LITPFTLTAQEDAHPPQFLYREGGQLVLVSITGETSEALPLPDVVAGDNDRFVWSPDGRYLLALSAPDVFSDYCLNVYDIARLDWISNIPIACHVSDAEFSHDGTALAYSTTDYSEQDGRRFPTNADVWLLDLQQQSTESIYHWSWSDTPNQFSIGLVGLNWSTHDGYLTFVQTESLLSSNDRFLIVYNIAPATSYSPQISTSSYASYDPIWSPDEARFLLRLQEEYWSHNFPTNHEGDVFLVHASDGEQYRLTYTPAERESNIRWTEDGRVAFDVVQSVYLEVDEALSVPEPNPNSIVQPQRAELQDMFLQGLYVFEESDLAAWVISKGDSPFILHIGGFSGRQHAYSTQLGEDYNLQTGIIGWRPTRDGDS
ncbi:MAG: hypothetical protein IPO91_32265, partial [Chloroflexi bacterium]|nr:hypothetical protein [Chloroflexota bacterium]